MMRNTALRLAMALLAGVLASGPAHATESASNPDATLVYFDAAANATLDPIEPQSNSSVPQAALTAVLRDLARLTTEQVSHIALMTRPSIYAYRGDCVLGMTSYLPAGSDRFNDVRISEKCK